MTQKALAAGQLDVSERDQNMTPVPGTTVRRKTSSQDSQLTNDDTSSFTHTCDLNSTSHFDNPCHGQDVTT